jgi:hypothetical protein
MKLNFIKLPQKEKSMFGFTLYFYAAKANGFTYIYETDFGFGKLCKGGIKTPDGLWMGFDTRTNKFLSDPQLTETWFNSHADGVAKAKE